MSTLEQTPDTDITQVENENENEKEKKKRKKRLRISIAIIAVLMVITGVIYLATTASGKCEAGIWIQKPTSYFSWVSTSDEFILAGSASPYDLISSVRVSLNGSDDDLAEGTGDWSYKVSGLKSGENMVVCKAYIGSKQVAADTVWVTRNREIEFFGMPEFSQRSFFIQTANSVEVSQLVGTTGRKPAKVVLLKLNDDFSPALELTSMSPSGSVNEYPEMKREIYRAVVELRKESSGPEYYRVAAYSKETGQVSYSPICRINFHQNISSESLEKITSYHDAIGELLKDKDIRSSRSAVKYIGKWLNDKPEVRSVTREGNTLRITYDSGLEGNVIISDVNENGEVITKGRKKGPSILRSTLLFLSGCSRESMEALAKRRKNRIEQNRKEKERHEAETENTFRPLSALPDSESIFIGNNKVLIWSPFEHTFSYDMRPELTAIFDQSSTDFQIDAICDFDCTINSLNDLTQYGTVIIDTHGRGGKSFLTGELVTEENMRDYTLLFLDGKINISTNMEYTPDGRLRQVGTFYSVNDNFIRDLKGEFSNSLIFNGSCSSSQTNALFDTFVSKGAKSYMGFNDVVSVKFAFESSKEFYSGMVLNSKPTGEAYNEKDDPYNPGTTFTLSGSPHLRYKGLNSPNSRVVEEDEITGANTPVSDNLILVAGGTSHNGFSLIEISSFYLGRYEVTQKEYSAVMGKNPSKNNQGGNHPVEMVTWFDAIEYCNRKSIRAGRKPCYRYHRFGTNPDDWPARWKRSDSNQYRIFCDWSADGYRLPTEMEWIFAARGGNNSRNYTYSGGNDIDKVAWYYDNSGVTTQPVGSKLPNELGIYDMSGNVEEWVWDFSGKFPQRKTLNYRGSPRGLTRSACGGSIHSSDRGCCIISQSGFSLGGSNASSKSNNLGFRICRSGNG